MSRVHPHLGVEAGEPEPRLASSATTRPRQLRDRIARHPVAAFLAWALPVTQALAFTPAVVEDLGGVQLPMGPFLVAGTLLGLLLPALVLTRLVDGTTGLRVLWSRVGRVAVPLRWYALALLGVPLVTAAISVAADGPPAELSAATVGDALLSGLVQHLGVALVTVNLWEELAWTGFVQDRLQRRHGALTAALVASPFFTLQHLALVVGGSAAGSAATLVLLLVLVVPFRALAGWVYNATHSLLLVGLVHAAGNATALGSVLGDRGLLPRLYAGQPGQSALAFALLGVVAVALTRGRLGRPRRRERAPAARPAGRRPAPAA